MHFGDSASRWARCNMALAKQSYLSHLVDNARVAIPTTTSHVLHDYLSFFRVELKHFWIQAPIVGFDYMHDQMFIARPISVLAVLAVSV